MQLYDQAEACRSVLARFAEQYAHHGDDYTVTVRGAKRTLRELRAAVHTLPPEPTPEQVAAIMPGWEQPPGCDECRQFDGRTVVLLGGSAYDSAAVCVPCLQNALALATASNPNASTERSEGPQGAPGS